MELPITHSGAWTIAIVMIVLASWAFYHFLAPRDWREWVGAGLVQGFIIALYAEMYGFPLTIYVLVRFFGLDRRHLDANLWSTLLDLGPAGMMISMILGYALLFVGIGIVVQGWRALYKARQDDRLVTDGPYGLVRHPQYTGLFLALFGEGVVHWPTIFSVTALPLIVLAYIVLSRREERMVIARFGDEYREYARKVPMFLPTRGNWRRFIGRTDDVM